MTSFAQFNPRRSVLATAIAAAALLTVGTAAQARCDKLSNAKAGEVNIIGNSFPALQHLAKEMESCTQGGLKVQFKMTPNARPETEQAFAVTGPVAFDAAVVSSCVCSGAEFVNMFVGAGGKFFKDGSAMPDFNSDAGVKAFENMMGMSKFMTPNFLASNSDDVMNQFQQGTAAMGVLWATRAGRMDDEKASKVVGKMEFVAAPAMMAGGNSATHLWWDGVVMPKNMKGDRETVFQVMMEALDEETMKKGNDLGVWLRTAYKPTRFGGGVAASANAGAPAWPTQPYFGLANAEINKVIPDVLTGTVSPRAGLAIAAAAYEKAAKEQGFIK